MSDTNAQEPTMEEILASIRRIISEDDASAAAPPPPAAPEPPPAVHAAPPPPPVEPARPEEEDDVLELTEPLDSPPARAAEPPAFEAPLPEEPFQASHFEETVGDLDVFSRAAAPPPSAGHALEADEPLVGAYAAESSASHFGALARSVGMPREGRTLEDVVRELLKPMLREWLDRHLPSIVEARVQAEVERISRRHDY